MIAKMIDQRTLYDMDGRYGRYVPETDIKIKPSGRYKVWQDGPRIHVQKYMRGRWVNQPELVLEAEWQGFEYFRESLLCTGCTVVTPSLKQGPPLLLQASPFD